MMRPSLHIQTITNQIAAMQCNFPEFTYRRENNIPTWRGTLQPSDNSPVYSVKIVYPIPRSPKVWVLAPALRSDFPHHYPDQSLCLYYPSDYSWTSGKLISQTIVPWTSLWLAYYEIWCVTRIWYGQEVQHSGAKIA